MKRWFVFLALGISFSCTSNKLDADRFQKGSGVEKIRAIRALDLPSYEGKPIGLLLK